MTSSAGQQGHDRCGTPGHKTGKPCELPAGWGTGHVGTGRCRKHLGNTPTHVTSAVEVQARQAAEKFGLPVTTTARQALIDELARANGLVIWLTARCQELDTEDLIWGSERKTVRTNPGMGAVGGEPQIEVVQSARLHVYAAWLERAQRHLFTVAAEMSRIGIEARQVRADEAMIAEFRRVTEGMLAALALTPEQRALVPEAVTAGVRALTVVPHEA